MSSRGVKSLLITLAMLIGLIVGLLAGILSHLAGPHFPQRSVMVEWHWAEQPRWSS